MTVNRIVIIRPGETDWNRTGRWQGWVAAPLSEHGRLQAQKLANFIRHIGLGALYTSDLRRAVETADLLAEQLGYSPIPDARLRERNIGNWQGLTLAEMQAWYPEEYQTLLADPDAFKVPGGESRAEVRQRMVSAFEDILAQDKSERVGIVSHTTAVRLLLEHLIPNFDQRGAGLENTSVTTIVCDENGDWSVVAVDDVMHLEGLPARSFGELEDKHDSGDR